MFVCHGQWYALRSDKPFLLLFVFFPRYYCMWRGCPAEVGYFTVSASWTSALNCNPLTMLPSWCENAADAVFSTPHLCLTTACPTHCSPAHVNLFPIRTNRLMLGLTHLTISTTDYLYHYHYLYLYYLPPVIRSMVWSLMSDNWQTA